MKILLIEDDIDLKEIVRQGLERESYTVDATSDGEKGSYLARTNDYDLILLDLCLPKKDGMSICKELRKTDINTPVIILSASIEVPSKVSMLDAGADDYITKPFSIYELFARIRSLLRRPKGLERAVLQVGDLMLDSTHQKVKRRRKNIYLTRKEFTLLEYLMRNKGKVISRGMLLEHVWEVDSDPFSNTVEAHILNVRKKIGGKGYLELIHNIPGRGYKIDVKK